MVSYSTTKAIAIVFFLMELLVLPAASETSPSMENTSSTTLRRRRAQIPFDYICPCWGEGGLNRITADIQDKVDAGSIEPQTEFCYDYGSTGAGYRRDFVITETGQVVQFTVGVGINPVGQLSCLVRDTVGGPNSPFTVTHYGISEIQANDCVNGLRNSICPPYASEDDDTDTSSSSTSSSTTTSVLGLLMALTTIIISTTCPELNWLNQNL